MTCLCYSSVDFAKCMLIHFYLLIYVAYGKKYCNGEETDPEILTNFDVSSSLNMDRWFLEYRLSVCLSVCLYVCILICLCTLQVPEWLDKFYLHLVFKSLSIINWYLMNGNILTSKIRACQMGSKKQNCDFLENGSDYFDSS
jgi:hypothetical protein